MPLDTCVSSRSTLSIGLAAAASQRETERYTILWTEDTGEYSSLVPIFTLWRQLGSKRSPGAPIGDANLAAKGQETFDG